MLVSVLISFCLFFLQVGWCWRSSSSAINKEQQVFTLGLVISNPNIDDQKLVRVIKDVQAPMFANSSSATGPYLPTSFAMLGKIRLQLNPVQTTGHGLNSIVKRLFCSPESRGMNAVFLLVDKVATEGHNGVLLSNFIATLGENAGLPTIAWSSNIVEFEQQMSTEFPMLLMAPSVRTQSRAIFSFLKRFLPDRKVSIIISPTASGFDHFLDELRQLSEKDEQGGRYSRFEFDSHQHHMSHRFIEVTNMDTNISPDNIRKELVHLRDSTTTKVFVLYTDKAIGEKVMEEAHLLGLTTNEYVWIFGKPAYDDVAPHGYLPGTLVVTYNTSINFQLLALKAAIRIWSEAVRRLVVSAESNEKNLFPTVSCTRFQSPKWELGPLFHKLLKQRFAKMMSVSGETFAALNDIRLLTLEVNRHWSQVGEWTTTHGLVVYNDKWLRRFEKRVHSVKLPLLRIVTLDEPPYVAYKQPKRGVCPENAVPCRLSPSNSNQRRSLDYELHEVGNEHFHRGNSSKVCCVGFVIDILRTLSRDIGFQFEMFEVADRKWGAYDASTGQWNGLVFSLLNGSADMVATSLKINTARSSAIEFSVPFYETGITILVQVRESMVSSVAFLEPFSAETWLIVFLGCVNGCALFIFFFENFNKIFNYQQEARSIDVSNSFMAASTRERRRKNKEKTSLFGSFWLVLSMLFNAAMKTNIPQSISARVVANVWAFFCVIFMSSFMANLAAFMITKEEFHDFTGLDDFRLKNPFSKNPPWKFSTIPHGATEQLIKANSPEMYEYMRRYTRNDVDDFVAAVKKGHLDAFIYDASVLTYKAGRDKNCQLRTVGKWYAPTGYGFGFPKSSKWLHLINKHILDYQVSGYLQHLEDFWLSSSCKGHYKKDKQRSAELGIVSFLSAFGILAGALGFCVILFGFEHYYAKRCRNRGHKHCDAICTLISPSLGKALLLKRRLSRMSNLRASQIFSSFLPSRDCANTACQFRQRYLQQQLIRSQERVRVLEARSRGSAIEDFCREDRLSRVPSQLSNSNCSTLCNFKDANCEVIPSNQHEKY